MSLYIIRPKTAGVLRSVSLMSRRLTVKNRIEQAQEISALWREDPALAEIRGWLTDAGQLDGKKIKNATGTVLAEMQEQDAERMRRELVDVMVLRDRPMHLIHPERQALAREKISKRDMWHLNAIGLGADRQGSNGYTGEGVTVAVLDTGIDQTHPELDQRVAAAFKFDVKKGEAVPVAKPVDTDGHGTHVAGLICGKSVGVAPGARVIDGLMLPKGRGNLSDFIVALEWAAKQPEIQVVNMSAGLDGFVPEMQSIVEDLVYVGLLPLFAVGNDGRNKTCSPGNYRHGLSVGACDRRKNVAAFSGGGTIVADNHQYVVPDLVAPGREVYSCVMGGGYEAWSGTSMATPIVAGIAALILEKHPDIPVSGLMEILLSTCKDLKEPVDRQGKGLVQARLGD